MKNLLITFLSLITISLSAQSSEIHGNISENTGEPVFFANVILYSAADSSLVKLEYTDEEGSFIVSGLDEGKYYLHATYVGFPDYISETFELGSDDIYRVEPIVLSSEGLALDEVVVTAKKPLLEMKPDKVVLNVEGSINAAGSDALTLLRQSPGVVIDNNDNIFMLGKSGLQIYINNKPSQLSGSDLTEYLRSIPSSEIEAIEIITNPSSRYEAEGNAGIINIKMRRDKNLGMNTSINSGYSIGEKARYSSTVRSTYKSKKLHTTASLSGYTGENYNPFNIYREQVGIVFDQSGAFQKRHNNRPP